MKKHRYRSVKVEEVRVAELLPLLSGGCIVALDVAKEKFVAALATADGEAVSLFRFDHPRETLAFLSVVEALQQGLGKDKVKAAMEPTGTYGDAVRYQLVQRAVPVHMIAPKRTYDVQALFDGVSSLHDPKSAVLVAKLCAMQLGSEWTPTNQIRVRMRALVERRRYASEAKETCLGRLEALLARHWPEFGAWMDLRSQSSAKSLLAFYGSPACVAAKPEEARDFLLSRSRRRLSIELIEGVLKMAAKSLGVPMEEEERQLVMALAVQTRSAALEEEEMEDALKELGRKDEAFQRLQRWMGTYTAAVVMALADPTQYGSATQFEKAVGLNLREKSSGEHQGKLKITKRGPGLVRQVLYLFSLRMLQESPPVAAWYVRRRGYTEDNKLKAVTAVMRKLTRATFHIAKGAEFDPSKLFDMERLTLTHGPRAPRRAPTARTVEKSRVNARQPASVT